MTRAVAERRCAGSKSWCVVMVSSPWSWRPPLAALMARLLPEARAGAAPRALSPRPERSGGRRGAVYFASRCKADPNGAAAENKRTSAVALRPRLWLPRHPQRPRGGPPFRKERSQGDDAKDRTRRSTAAPPVDQGRKRERSSGTNCPIDPRFHGMSRTGAQIDVEILAARLQAHGTSMPARRSVRQAGPRAKSPAASLSRST